MTAAKHAVRYLGGTTDLPIVYKRGQFRMVPYTDESFGANPDNRKPTTGSLLPRGRIDQLRIQDAVTHCTVDCGERAIGT